MLEGIAATFLADIIKSIAKKIKSLFKAGRKEASFIKQKYLEQLIKYHKNLRFTGIPDLKEKKEIALPSVFVMQRVVEEVPVEEYMSLVREHEGEGDEESAFADDEIGLLRRLREERKEKVEPVKFDGVFEESDNRRFVILGNPGSGKTSLVKYLLLKSARAQLDDHRRAETLLFPILVEIRKLEIALKKSSKTDYCILDYLYDSVKREYNLGLPAGFFEARLERGNALLLFDGLDEVAEEVRRSEVQRMISAFIDIYHRKNTVMITSRISGYSRARFSTTEFRHFTLQDFNDEEIDTFTHKWYRSRLTNENEARQKAEDLQGALRKKPRIMELARNPLLLTIIGIIHRYEAQLPEDRLVLYDKATEALLYTWDSVKAIIDEKFKLEDRRRFLEKVAFHLQMEEKGEEAGTVIDRSELYKILFPDFKNIFCCDNRRARSLVEEFLETIRTRSGLLVELAPDQFGFVHKTFQEYFAARFIANEAQLNFNIQILIDYVDKYIGNSFWQETLLLALRALPNKQTRIVLGHILKKDEEGEINQYLHHHHYFVMKFLAEQGSWLNNRTFVETQIKNFFNFSWNNGENRSFSDNKTWRRFEIWITAISDSLTLSMVSETLLSKAEDEKQAGGLRRYCAIALGNLEVKDDKAVVDRLLKLAEDEKQAGYLRRYCALALGNLGVKDKAVDILLKLAEDEKQAGYLRSDCARVLGNLGVKDKAVVDRLLKLAEDEKQAGGLRSDCALALGNLGMKDKAVDILLKLTEDEKQAGGLRRYCAIALGNLEVKDDKAVVDRLLKLAEDEKQDGLLRSYCAIALGILGVKDKALVDRFLKLAEDEKQDGLLRSYCALALGILGVKDKAVMDRLLKLAEDKKQEGDLRRDCARALGNSGMKDKAVDILLKLAEDEKQAGYLRSDCARVLGNLGVKDKAVVDRLLKLAEDEKQAGDLRSDCALALGNLGMKDKAVDILSALYIKQQDKYEFTATSIYSSLWDLTAV